MKISKQEYTNRYAGLSKISPEYHKQCHIHFKCIMENINVGVPQRQHILHVKIIRNIDLSCQIMFSLVNAQIMNHTVHATMRMVKNNNSNMLVFMIGLLNTFL